MEFRDVMLSVTGAAVGAVALTVVGFSGLGWQTPSAVDRIASARAEAAVVDVLAPICVKQFQQQDNFAVKLAELKKVPSWERYAVIEKAGWATLPGTEETHAATARACAEKIGDLS